jgi:SOS-response transcriptional repressor LexA
VALGKMRKIPVISWVAAGRWTETGEKFLEEDVIEWYSGPQKSDNGVRW